MEKAKSLEEAAAAAKAKAASSAASNTASIASTTLASFSERGKTKNNLASIDQNLNPKKRPTVVS